jgi:hypothetical protein
VIAALLIILAQAEPAPPEYRPPNRPGVPQPTRVPEPERPEPKWHISVAPHLAVLLAQGPDDLPLVGYGAGVQLARALVPLGRGRFGLAADFAYDRVSHDKKTGDFSSGTELVAHATFAGLLVVDGIAGRFRPWVGAGGGFSVAQYEDPRSAANPMGTSNVTVVGLVKLALGFGVRVYEGIDLGLRGDFDLTFSSATGGAPARQLFAPGLFTLGLDIGFRF